METSLEQVVIAIAALVLGIEIGRLTRTQGPAYQVHPPDVVSRSTLDAELERFSKRLAFELEDARDKFTSLAERTRKRVEVASRRPQDEPQPDGEALPTNPKLRAREKARRLRLVQLRGLPSPESTESLNPS